MSLLLDALKRAAQEKLEKQRQDENGGAPGEQRPNAPAELSLELDDEPLEVDATGRNSRAFAAESAAPPSNTDLRLHRADVLASELQAFMSGNPTERNQRGPGETADKTAPGRPAGHAPGAYAATLSPAAAAQMFRNKRAGISSRPGLLIGGTVAALLLIAGFYAVYINSLGGSNVQLERLLAATPVPDAPADTRAIEQALLAEQETLGTLGAREAAVETGGDPQSPVAPSARTTDSYTSRPPAEPRAAARSTPRLRVQKNRQEALHAVLMRAYNAYQSGDIAEAAAGYRQALARVPENRDALLGFAAISTHVGDYAAAMESYVTLLNLDPNDDLALAGISGLQQETAADGSLLRRLLLKRPDSAQLHFALGNVYAGAADWPKAQSAYFDAHRYDSGNPDYAYNLAVSLEHLGQAAAALRYYQLALDLAVTRKPNFDTAQAERRITILQPQPTEAAGDA